MGKTEKRERMARAKEACQTLWADVKAEREANEVMSLIMALDSVKNKNREENRQYFEDELDVKVVEYFSVIDVENDQIRYDAVVEMYCDKEAVMKVMLSDYTHIPQNMDSGPRCGVRNEVLLLVYTMSALNGAKPSQERLVSELNYPPVRR